MRCFLCGLGDRLCGLDDLVLCGSRVAGSWEAVVGSGSVREIYDTPAHTAAALSAQPCMRQSIRHVL